MTDHEINLMAMSYAREEISVGKWPVSDVLTWAREAAVEAAKPEYAPHEAAEFARYAADLLQWVAARERE